jgi:hypothetical protein
MCLWQIRVCRWWKICGTLIWACFGFKGLTICTGHTQLFSIACCPALEGSYWKKFKSSDNDMNTLSANRYLGASCLLCSVNNCVNEHNWKFLFIRFENTLQSRLSCLFCLPFLLLRWDETMPLWELRPLMGRCPASRWCMSEYGAAVEWYCSGKTEGRRDN